MYNINKLFELEKALPLETERAKFKRRDEPEETIEHFYQALQAWSKKQVKQPKSVFGISESMRIVSSLW